MLTNKSISSLQPGDVIWDDKVKGLHVKANANSKSFMLYYRANGKARRPKIGTAGVVSIAEARTLAKDILRKSQTNYTEQITMEQLYDKWISTDAGKLKQSTIRAYMGYWRNHIRPAMARQAVGDIKPSMLVSLHAGIGGPISNRVVSFISTLLEFAIRLDYIQTNPAKYVRYHSEQPRKRFATERDIENLKRGITILKASGTDGKIFALYIELSLLTGMRKSELEQLKWEYVNAEIGKICLPDSKTGYKEIALSERAIECIYELASITGQCSYVFPAKKSKRGIDYEKRWQTFKRTYNLSDLRRHDLRRSYAILAINQAGLPLQDVSALLSHKSTRTTEKSYAWLLHESKRAASDKVGKIISEQLS